MEAEVHRFQVLEAFSQQLSAQATPLKLDVLSREMIILDIPAPIS